MKALVTGILALIICLPALAQNSIPSASDPKPSDASVRRLLELMGARKIVDDVPRQVDSVMVGMLQNMLQGREIPHEQQQLIDAMRANMTKLMRDEFNWDTMQPIYLQVYRDTFSQAEVNSMIAFYGSPTGQAVAKKLPLALQNTMTIMQQRTAALMPKIQQMVRDTAEQIRAENAVLKNKTTS